MSGDWIKMRMNLQSHPKVVRILSAMRPHDVRNATDKFRVIGGLHAVWCVFDEHSEDGVLRGYTPETLDHVIGWTGFADAMIGVEWLEVVDGNSLIMPEFSEHNGQSAKRRAEDTKRKRVVRMSASCPQPVRKESGQNADKKRTREEKRREEISNTPPTPPRGNGSDVESGSYTQAFEAAWADYPRRAGSNSKAEAFKKWNARLKQGKTEQAMHAGVKRYAEFVRSDGKEGTQYVQQAATFFGPGLHFEETWVPAKEISQLDVDMECNPEKQRELAKRFLAQERAKPMPDWMRERL